MRAVCSVVKRSPLSEAELVSGIERSPPVHSCRPMTPQDSSLTHGGSPLAIARGGRRRLSTQKSAQTESLCTQTTLLHRFWQAFIMVSHQPSRALASRLPEDCARSVLTLLAVKDIPAAAACSRAWCAAARTSELWMALVSTRWPSASSGALRQAVMCRGPREYYRQQTAVLRAHTPRRPRQHSAVL